MSGSFDWETERYAALVDTLIQLRQPQLSKNPDQNRLSEALTQALPPLDRASARRRCRGMSELDDIRRDLKRSRRCARRLPPSGHDTDYTHRSRHGASARGLRQAQTEYDNASREVNTAQKELGESTLQKLLAAWQTSRNWTQQLARRHEARLRVLQLDPVCATQPARTGAKMLAEKARGM